MLPEQSYVYRILCLLGGALLTLTLPGCGAGGPPAEETAPPAPVKWMEARQFFIEEWTEVIGTTQPLPDRAARVSAAIEGRVVSILGDGTSKPINEGQLVKKGDLLVQLDDRIARATRDKAEADQRDLEQQVVQAGFGVELAAIELRRVEELSKKSVPGGQILVAPVEMDRARVALDDAKSKLRGAELKAKAGEKALKAIEEQLKLYSLTAPISGRLSRILVVKGQTLSVGAPVAEILDIEDQIDLLCFVPVIVKDKLRQGQAVRIQLLENQTRAPAAKSDSKEGETDPRKKATNTDGKIVYIADQSEVDTGNFAVKARFSNSGRRLPSNLTVRALVLTAPGRATLTLPDAAVMEDQIPPTVVVVEDHHTEKTKEGKDMEVGKARKLQAKIGIRDQVLHLVEITGVSDPEKKWQGTLDTAKFVVEKGQGLRNGDSIKLEEEDEDEAAPAPEKKENAP